MSNSTTSSTDKDPWLLTLCIVLLRYLIVKPTRFVMLALGRPFKNWFSRVLALPARSDWWGIWGWLLKPVQWVAALVFFGALIEFFRVAHISDAKAQLLFVFERCMVCLGTALIFDIFAWLEEYADDPATQKLLAGQKAEQLVKELVDGYRDQNAEAQSLHGALFVFHPGSTQEFSVEIDHLLVTRRNVFVIETKYKSGTITATAEAAEWKVETSSGSSSMRNALKQAKNAARVLQQQFSLPCEIVPVVAITGHDVQLNSGPTNVVTVYELPPTLRAFDAMQEERITNPSHVLAQLQKHISTDPTAMQRHIARAEAARAKNEMTEIVQAASLQ